MSGLAPVAGKSGVWADPAVGRGDPATYAVVIGVSTYWNLDGGKGSRAADTYGLRQLAVSALTAYRFFRWLADDYLFDGAPVGRVWLLTAPTVSEVAVTPPLADAGTAPTMAACETAIREWFATMRALPPAVAAASRSFFFFSGHGLEVTQERQVLLPCDYLAPLAGGLNDAISTLNLRNGLAVLDVATQFFYMDACRNDHERLRGKVVEGRRILDEASVGEGNPDITRSVLYATGPGNNAWQPTTPDRGPSLYGAALVGGLGGAAGWEERDDQQVIEAVRLGAYVDTQVRNGLKAVKPPVRQPVNTTTAFGIPVTCRRPDDDVRGFGQPGPHTMPSLDERVDVARDAGMHWDSRTDGSLPDMLGDQDVTDVWERSRVHDFATGAWTSAVQALRLRSVEIAQDQSYRAVVHQTVGRPLWWEIDDARGRHVVLLPGVPDAHWEVLFDRVDGEATYVGVDVDLAPVGPDALVRAAQLWRRYRYADAATAAATITDSDVAVATATPGLPQKLITPQTLFGGIVASLILLRGRPHVVGYWLGSIARAYDLPDGTALWAEHLARTGRSHDAEMELIRLSEIRLLPATGEALSYVDGMLNSHPNGVIDLTHAELSNRVRRVLPYYRPGGFLVTLFDAERIIEPSLVSGRVATTVPI